MNGYVGLYGRIINKEEIIEDSHPKEETDGINSWHWWIGDLLCIEESDDTFVLAHPRKGWKTRIAKSNFAPRGMPTYHIGDIVYAKSRKKQATIVGVTWHDKRECFRYTLDYGDRVSTNWFFDDDLEMVECKWRERFDG